MERAELLFIIYVISFTIYLTSAIGEQTANGSNNTSEVGECYCAGFAEGGIQPLVAHPAGPATSCNSTGADLCRGLCIALATMAQAKGHGVLCAKIGTVDQVKMSVHHKICNDKWAYSGLTMNEPLCCENGVARTCPVAVTSESLKTPISNQTTA